MIEYGIFDGPVKIGKFDHFEQKYGQIFIKNAQIENNYINITNKCSKSALILAKTEDKVLSEIISFGTLFFEHLICNISKSLIKNIIFIKYKEDNEN